MDSEVFAVEARHAATHWWFAGRRHLFMREITRLGKARIANVFDVGTSTGGNLVLLGNMGFSNVFGIDYSEDALRWCREKNLNRLVRADVCALPVTNGCADLVVATDVIEHVSDDLGALKEIARALRAGGHVLITVPAFRILWGPHDVSAGHARRYNKREIEARVHRAGFTILRSYYFNYLLFFPILILRHIIRLMGLRVFENDVNSPKLNSILKLLFAVDIATAPYIRPPFGVSVFVLAEKTEISPEH